jgi:hypothetical protein
LKLKLRRREGLLIGMLAVAAAVVLWQQLSGPGVTPARLSRSRPQAPLPPIPRIDLARLDVPRADVAVGQRDIFDYGQLERAAFDPESQPTPPPVQTTAPRPVSNPSGGTQALAGGAAGLPPLNLKFIGSVGNAEGVKVAVLITERNEVLTGQSGEVVANRYRIARIGIESVDLEDVGTGQSRRIPLNGK